MTRTSNPFLRLLILTAGVSAAVAGGNAPTAGASEVFSDSFTFPSGSLVDQGGWTQTGTSAVTPIQVGAGEAVLGTSGQDAYRAFSTAVTPTAGTSIYTAAAFTVTAAQATGDYFLHVSNPTGTTTNFYQRFFARSAGGGFQLGLLDTSGTNSATTWGTAELALDTEYRAVIAWTFLGGANDDTFSVYIDPTDPVQANNATYLTHAWTSTSVLEPAALAAVNLRQGSAANAANVRINELAVATSFAEVVPEPASLALLGLAGLALLRRRRSCA